MQARNAASALVISLLGFTQAAYPAGDPAARTAAAQAVLHHSVKSEAQQGAAETSLRCAAQARISPQQAISDVARQTSGTVVQASFMMDGGKPAYAVRAVSGKSVWRGHVNADNGVIRDSVTATEHSVDPAERLLLRLAERTRLPIGRAVGLAEHATGGRVIDALLVNVRGRPEYQMQVLRSDAVHNVVVDPAGGTVRLVG